jgi:hypothetical protein
MGWTAIKNGVLLALVAEHFDVLLTLDRNLSFQQNLRPLPISVVVLCAKSNRLADLRQLVPRFMEALGSIERGTLIEL